MGKWRPGRRHLHADARVLLRRPGPGDEPGGLRAGQTGGQWAAGQAGRQEDDPPAPGSRQPGRQGAARPGAAPHLHLRPLRRHRRAALDHQDRRRRRLPDGPAAPHRSDPAGQRTDQGRRADHPGHPGDLAHREWRGRLGAPGARALRGRHHPQPRRQDAAGMGALGTQGRVPDRRLVRQQRSRRSGAAFPRIRRDLHGALPQHPA
ncbi:hypothetical protein D9M71_470150 [compost metagenome]